MSWRDETPDMASSPRERRGPDGRTLYQARCGWRRQFFSVLDCQMYERGYGQFPQAMEPGMSVSPPYLNGWFDAERDDETRREARASGFSDTRDDRGFYS